MPTFDHSFVPSATSGVGATVDLSVREIEDAGLREILQIPGAAVGNWKILGALLDPSVSTFSFLEPLGQAREVKTAVSGLFGRFVARAYATRHLGLTHFVHIRKPPMRLSGPLRGELRRVPGMRGDMPDWVAWGPRRGMAIVEAKGCHDSNGPQAALTRAVRQAQRAQIFVPGARVPFKRYAIATRWGFSGPIVTNPMLWVHDPEEDGDLTLAQENELVLGVRRWHVATLLAPLGHASLAKPLLRLAQTPLENRRLEALRDARTAFERIQTYRVQSSNGAAEDELIGGFVVRGASLSGSQLTESEQNMLKHLELAPTFVGLERQIVDLAIGGEGDEQSEQSSDFVRKRRAGEDGAGGWVIRLEQDEARVIPASRQPPIG